MAMVLRAMERSTIGLTFLAMRNENNVVESIFCRIIGIPEKTKDNFKARVDQ
jgi:hypothetical protein